MDAYPEELITHEIPLLVISGLGSKDRLDEAPPYPFLENGPLVASPISQVTGPTGDALLSSFRKRAGRGLWAGLPEKDVKIQRPVFRIRAVGREYRLPPRKANAPSPGSVHSPMEGALTRELHSPISPLSPDSPLYPDGVFSHIWLRKHQSILPAVFVSFYELYSDTRDGNLQDMKDSEMISAINQEKRSFIAQQNNSMASIGADELRSSGCRTKYVSVIMADRSAPGAAIQDDRLNTIRRNTNLSTNVTFFVLPSNSSPQEMDQFVSAFLSALHPGAVEYYREMSKHTRRKRNKGSVPPPTVPSSRALSSQAWTLRYEFKLGVFSEFRQEMDGAGRNYETTYEKLLTEIFETTSSWTERWSEARLLADILTIRMIRCNLWLENYVAAKQRWNYHINRMRDVLNRRGKGTETYGFAAWMSRWNQCLADLIHSGKLSAFAQPVRSLDLLDLDIPAIYAEPPFPKPGTKSLTTHDILHHTGFYYLAAAEWTKRRKVCGSKISPEDNADIHDTYLCPMPREEASTIHYPQIISLLQMARTAFNARQQTRMVNSVTNQIARIMMLKAAESPELWSEALKELRSIAATYRREGWWSVLDDILWAIVECGKHAGDASSTFIAAFELMCGLTFKERAGWKYSLSSFLDGIDVANKPTIVIRAGEVACLLSTSYAFEHSSIHVGQLANSQFTMSSCAQRSSLPLVFSELRIMYEGGLKTVVVRHKEEERSNDGAVRIINLSGELRPIDTHLEAEADLSITSGQIKIYSLSSILREPGSAKANTATLELVGENFELDIVIKFGDEASEGFVHPLPKNKNMTAADGWQGLWWFEDEGKLKKRIIKSLHPETLTILPRPPKMEVIAEGLEKGVYVDETVSLALKVVNGEDEEANVNLGIKILGWAGDNPPEITWKLDDSTDSVDTTKSLGVLPPSSRTTLNLTFLSSQVPVDCNLEIQLRYHLLSDPDTPIEKTVSVDMPIINPFHTTFDFSPRMHLERWPDCFSISDHVFDSVGSEQQKKAHGIVQRWCLLAKILGVGEDMIHIESWEFPVVAVGGNSECFVNQEEKAVLLLEPAKTLSIPSILDIQKFSIEDRTPTTVDTSLVIFWRRPFSSNVARTVLSVPRLFAPLREPRVLLTAQISPPAMLLTYTIENPTNYFLTFSVLMETNVEFAFSGPKQTSALQLPPASRAQLEYRVLPYQDGVWIRPSLKVVDRYFNKTLKCAPGGEGLGMDKGGLVVWVPEIS